MHRGVNFYHTSEIGEERNVIVKKEQTHLAQMALVFKVMINTIHITCIFKNLSIKFTKNKLSRDFSREFHLA